MSKDLKRMGLSARNFGKIAGVSFDKAKRAASGFKSVVSGILVAGAIRKGFSLLQQGVAGLTDEIIQFDDAITAASAKFGVFDRESEVFKDLQQTAREVGATTEYTGAQGAEGLRFLAKAGWEANAAMKALPSFVNLATASEMEFARAADIATDVMGAFNLKSDDATKNLENLIRTNDVMAKAVNMSNIDMEDLFETIKMAGPIANTAGVSLEKFGAIAAFVGGAGIKGSLGGTALRTMFLSMAAPTKAATKLFKDLRIELRTASNDLRDPVVIMQELKKAMEGMGKAQKAAALNVLFGKRAVSGASVSMDGATDALVKFEKALAGAGGTSKKMAEFMRKSLGGRLKLLRSAAIDVGFAVYEAFEKQIPGGIETVIKAIRNFDPQPIIDGIRKTIDVIKELVDLIKGGVQFVKDYRGALLGLGAAVATIKIGRIVLSVIQLVKFMKVLAGMGGLKAALAVAGLNPLVLAIAAAVGGVAAAVYTVTTNWNDLKIAVGWLVEDITSGLTSLARTILQAFDSVWLGIRDGFISVLNLIIEGAKKLGGLFNIDTSGAISFLAGIRDGIKEAGDALKQFAKTPQLPAGGARAKPLVHATESGLLRTPQQKAFDKFYADPFSGFKSPAEDSAVRASAAQRAEMQRQQIRQELSVKFMNAPKGTEVTSKGTPGAPPIKTEMLGSNP